MLTHAEKYFVVKEGMKSWAIQTFGIIAQDFEPDEFDVEEQIKEFDKDGDDFWEKVEVLLNGILEEEEELRGFRRKAVDIEDCLEDEKA